MRKQTQDEFIDKSIVIFGDQLDYSKVDYIDSRTEVILMCKSHGDFNIKPKDHISYKRGCSVCSGVKYNTETFIETAGVIHDNEYIYDKVKYITIKTPIIIVCKIHGDFTQLPDKHINAEQGCPKCKKTARRDIEYIIKKAADIHKGFYDYSLVKFTRMFDNITIVCPLHGEFKQTPTNHINHKQRCPACAIGKSKKEASWLDQIGLPNDKDHRTVILYTDNKRLIVDGFDPLTNTVYEFYGDFWHGNPQVYRAEDTNDANHINFGELYSKTINREKLILKNGHNIVSIWEKDFDIMDKNKRERGKNR